MTTTNKDFKVKNEIQVSEDGTFGGPVAVGTPQDPEHAATKGYVDDLAAIAGFDVIDAGTPTTEAWGLVLDGGAP